MARTDWGYNDVVTENDMNQFGQEINALTAESIPFVTASGQDDYTVVLPELSTIKAGTGLKVLFKNPNTGEATIDINGFGAVNIKKVDGTLAEGDIQKGIYLLVNNGDYWQLTGGGSSASVKITHEEVSGHFNRLEAAQTSTDRLNYAGYFYATRVYNAVYNDYAEYFEKEGVSSPGDIIGLNICTGKYRKAQIGDIIVGVHSDSYGYCMGGDGKNDVDMRYIPVGLIGRVKVKVWGPVDYGDQIIFYQDGVGIAGGGKGCVGTALESSKEGMNLISVLIGR